MAEKKPWLVEKTSLAAGPGAERRRTRVHQHQPVQIRSAYAATRASPGSLLLARCHKSASKLTTPAPRPPWSTELSQIKQEMQGVVTTGVQQSLGYLWTLPEDSTSNDGLGGGIAYAWDPTVFDTLLPNFREDMFYVNWLGEQDLRAAGQRAFFSWSANHKHISFLDMTKPCEDLGYPSASDGVSPARSMQARPATRTARARTPRVALRAG